MMNGVFDQISQEKWQELLARGMQRTKLNLRELDILSQNLKLYIWGYDLAYWCTYIGILEEEVFISL
jgi:hypothetical protein